MNRGSECGFFVANCSGAEVEDGEQKGAGTCSYLYSCGRYTFPRGRNLAVSLNSKFFHCNADLCSQRCACGSLVPYTVLRQGLFNNFLNWKHVLAERSIHAEDSRKDQFSADRSGSQRRLASNSRYLLCVQLHSIAPFSCETASGIRKPDRNGCSGGDKYLECSFDVHWLGIRQDCLLAYLHLRQ